MRRIIPESTSPIKAIKKPIPATIAVLRLSGTASNTAVRKPVSTSTVIIRPAIITRPIISAHVSPGVVAIVDASSAFTPSPAAIAKGCLAITPMRIVITPATSAVTAATCGTPRVFPAESAPVPITRGLRTTM